MNCKFRTSDLSGTGQISTWTHRYLDTGHSWVETSHFLSRIVYIYTSHCFFMQDHVDVNAHVLIPTNHLIVYKCHKRLLKKGHFRPIGPSVYRTFELSSLRTIGSSDYRPFGLSDLRITEKGTFSDYRTFRL